MKNPAPSADSLYLAEYDAYTRNHGPGNRFAIWLQGCRRRCAGCINPHMLPGATEDQNMSIEQVIHLVGTQAGGGLPIEGVSIMGGEPMEQSPALAKFLKTLRTKLPHLNSLLFTGFTIEDLQRSTANGVRGVLELVDTIIDGPFVQEELDNELIRGSRNQRIIHLTDRLIDRDFSRMPHAGMIIKPSGSHFAVHQSGFNQQDLVKI